MSIYKTIEETANDLILREEIKFYGEGTEHYLNALDQQTGAPEATDKHPLLWLYRVDGEGADATDEEKHIYSCWLFIGTRIQMSDERETITMQKEVMLRKMKLFCKRLADHINVSPDFNITHRFEERSHWYDDNLVGFSFRVTVKLKERYRTECLDPVATSQTYVSDGYVVTDYVS